ncbi:MAG: ATP-binding cassette domain-containing protein [Tepidisphaeraceae bacterium]
MTAAMTAAPQATSALKLTDVAYQYGDRAALAGITLDVAPGQMFGLLGPNGSGKSTLFKLLSTILNPQKGSLSVFGVDVAAQAGRRAAAHRRRLPIAGAR